MSLKSNYLKWAVGYRDAFYQFKNFDRTIEFCEFINEDETIILELFQLQEDTLNYYIVANSYSTLFASKHKDLAQTVFNEFKYEYKQIFKEKK